MRAKTINEVNKFKRGLDPKVAMNIGGIILEDTYIKTVVAGIKEWKKYLNSFVGKKVTFYIDKDKYMHKNRPDQESFIVKEITCASDGGVNFFNEHNVSYYVDVTKKIYVN